MKELYSITELEQLGYSRKQLNRLVRSIYSTGIAIRTSTKGKWLIKKEKLDKWLEKNFS